MAVACFIAPVWRVFHRLHSQMFPHHPAGELFTFHWIRALPSWYGVGIIAFSQSTCLLITLLIEYRCLCESSPRCVVGFIASSQAKCLLITLLIDQLTYRCLRESPPRCGVYFIVSSPVQCLLTILLVEIYLSRWPGTSPPR